MPSADWWFRKGLKQDYSGLGNSEGKWCRFKPRQGRNWKKERPWIGRYNGEWDEKNVREVKECGEAHDYVKNWIHGNPQFQDWWELTFA